MPGPRLRTCSMNNLPPRWVSLSAGVRREAALWAEALLSKPRAFLEVGACDAGGPGEGEKLHTASKKCVSLISWLPFLAWEHEGFHRCMSDLGRVPGAPAWRGQSAPVVLPAALQGRAQPGEMEACTAQEDLVYKGCLLLSSVRLWVQAVLQAVRRLLESLLQCPGVWVQGWIWNRGFAHTTLT